MLFPPFLHLPAVTLTTKSHHVPIVNTLVAELPVNLLFPSSSTPPRRTPQSPCSRDQNQEPPQEFGEHPAPPTPTQPSLRPACSHQGPPPRGGRPPPWASSRTPHGAPADAHLALQPTADLRPPTSDLGARARASPSGADSAGTPRAREETRRGAGR